MRKIGLKELLAREEFYSDKVVISVGRDGSNWLSDLCVEHKISSTTGDVDIGVRGTRNEIMEELNEVMYESKLSTILLPLMIKQGHFVQIQLEKFPPNTMIIIWLL